MDKVVLYYDSGSITIKGNIQIPYSTIDPLNNKMRSLALYYRNILEYLKNSELEFEDNVMDLIPFPSYLKRKLPINLRDYQERSIKNWISAGKWGCIILPTGAGKTLVGISIIESIKEPTLIVVPTIELMEQWNSTLSNYFQEDLIGMIGGGYEDIKPITVITYDSAYIKSTLFGNRYDLVIFDEVHHLASSGYRTIAENMTARYRLGLTATIEREDDKQKDLPRLVGGIVYRGKLQELSEKKYLADFEISSIKVSLTQKEKEQYGKLQNIYLTNLRKLGIFSGKDSFKRLIWMSGNNIIAKEALDAKRKANDIALNSESKILALTTILRENNDKKIIIFTEHNKLVYRISNRFLVPYITHKTDKDERKEILNHFKSGTFSAIVTSKVFDEGIDVPDAELGVIMSGSGSRREFVQRLGRVLRPKSNEKKARIIEIVSTGTTEITKSSNRKSSIKNL